MAKPAKPGAADGLALDNFLCFSIYSAGHAFNQFYRPLLDGIGLTYPQYLVMVTLWSTDNRTVKEVGQTLFLESNTLTPLLKRLEGLGYIARTRDPDDERQVRVRLTKDGKALRAKAAAIPTCVAEAVGISADQAGKLHDQLSAIRDRLLVKG